MAFGIIQLEDEQGRERGFCLRENDTIFSTVYFDKNHAEEAGPYNVREFDEHSAEFDIYTALPSDGFPPGFRPFAWSRGTRSLGLIVWGPGGMVSRGYDLIQHAVATCEHIASKHAFELGVEASTVEVTEPKGL